MLSNTCKYGIRAMLYITLHEGDHKIIGLKKISEDLDIPSPFLGKILQLLAKHKILTSTKGPHGGFRLAKKSEEITILNIVEIIDGLDFFNSCLMGLRSCGGKPEIPCSIHKKYGVIREELYDLYKKASIQELLRDIKKGKDFLI